MIDASYTDLQPLVRLCTQRRRWLVHFSTCEVYGRAALDGEGRPMAHMNEEESAMWLGPLHRERWTYACAKQLLERVIYAHGRHHGLPFTIVRPFNVIGPRMDFVPDIDGEGIPRVLANFMAALLREQELLLVEGGRRRRSFVSIDDFVEGVVRIIERPTACQGQVFNLGNPVNDVSIAVLADELARAYRQQVPGPPVRLRSVSAEELYGPGYDDCDERIPDIGKAQRLLDWIPRTALADMLPPIVADYRARYGSAIADERAASARRQPVRG